MSFAKKQSCKEKYRKNGQYAMKKAKMEAKIAAFKNGRLKKWEDCEVDLTYYLDIRLHCMGRRHAKVMRKKDARKMCNNGN